MEIQPQIWNSVLELDIHCEPFKFHHIPKPAKIAHTETKDWIFVKEKQIIIDKAEVSVRFLPDVHKQKFHNVLIN